MGLRALVDALATPEQAQRLVLLDHLDRAVLEHELVGADPAKLGLIVISRSGTTLEVLAWLRELPNDIRCFNDILICLCPITPYFNA